MSQGRLATSEDGRGNTRAKWRTAIQKTPYDDEGR